MVYDLNRLAADASHGKFGHVGVDRYLITNQVKSVDSDNDVDMADATTLGNTAQNNLPGIPKGQIKIELVHSPTLDYLLQPLKRQQSPVFAFSAKRGLDAGKHIEMFPASFGKDGNKYDEKSVGTESTELGTRGDFHMGRILLSPTTLLSGASGTGPIDDNTAFERADAPSWGGCAYLFVWGVVAGTAATFTPKVQHSATSGGTYTDLATFQAVSVANGLYVQQVYIPSTTTILPFTQVSWATTGVPTGVQAMVGLGRSFNPAR